LILDQRFKEFLVRRIGTERYKKLSPAARGFALEHWQDYIKPNYQGPLDSEVFADMGYCIPLPGITDIPKINLKGGIPHMER
jgi:hypothetical protein